MLWRDVLQVLPIASQRWLLLHRPDVVTYLLSVYLASSPQAPFLQNAAAVRGSIRHTAFLSLSSRSLKKIFFFFCLLVPLHFSHLHAEPCVKTLGAEAQEVGGKKSWSKSLLTGSMEQKNRLKLHNCELGELRWACCVRVFYQAIIFRGAKGKCFSSLRTFLYTWSLKCWFIYFFLFKTNLLMGHSSNNKTLVVHFLWLIFWMLLDKTFSIFAFCEHRSFLPCL